MIVVLSPAKNLNFDRDTSHVKSTKPVFIKEAAALAEVMQKKTARDLSKLMGISEKLAELNATRYQAFADAPGKDLTQPAALTFNGEVYLGLEAKTMSSADLNWAQDHLRILSGLYGVLRPLDAIQPYRLEMGTRLKTPRGTSLYEWWSDLPTKQLNKDLGKSGGETLINLASDEYFNVVKPDALKAKIITPVFKDIKDDKARALFVYFKRARGRMARWIIDNRITDAEALKTYNVDGYKFDKKLSSEREFVFTRPQPKPLKPIRKKAT